jgi:hypothetical protein
MHTPTKTRWNTVIDNLKKILPLASEEGQLDMHEHRVQHACYKCGTIHCVGGWYAIAAYDLINNPFEMGFSTGADRMALDLGFIADEYTPSRQLLGDWADEHPEIWGNIYGMSVFTSSKAYNGAKNMAEVIQFLEKVRDRSPD